MKKSPAKKSAAKGVTPAQFKKIALSFPEALLLDPLPLASLGRG
jgi:hypothetical protein